MRFAVVGDRERLRARLLEPLGARACELALVGGSAAATIDAIVVAPASAASEQVVAAVAAFAARGGPVIGVGSGLGALCEWGLLDGAVADVRAVAPDPVHCVVEGRPTPFTHAIPAGRHVRMTMVNRAGSFAHPDVDALESDARVVARFATADGEVRADADPTGSVNNIAGICNDGCNVVGFAPQPPAAVFESALAWDRGSPARV